MAGKKDIQGKKKSDRPSVDQKEKELFERMYSLFLNEQQDSDANFEQFRAHLQKQLSNNYVYSRQNLPSNLHHHGSEYVISERELKVLWLKIYSDSKNYTADSNLKDTTRELKSLIKGISNSPNLKDRLSTILFRIRCMTRSITGTSRLHDSKSPMPDFTIPIQDGTSPFGLFRSIRKKLERLGLDNDLKLQIDFALGYEKAVLLNSKSAFSRSLTQLSQIQNQSFDEIRICHPALTFPKEMAEVLTIYTKSMIGAQYESREFESKIQKLHGWASEQNEELTEQFNVNSLAIVQYYLQVSLERLSGLHYNPDFWMSFDRQYPYFYPDRVRSYLMQKEQKQVPWQSDMQASFKFLIENQSSERDSRLRDLIKNGLDLSANNPTSGLRNTHLNFRKRAHSKETRDIHFSSSYEINKWISYIDLMKFNLFRVTKSDQSHHLVRFGPFDLQSNRLTWIKSQHSGITSGESDPQYLFRQYLRQNYKTSKNLKTTKLDRINLISIILDEIYTFLWNYAPSSRYIPPWKLLMNYNRKPILTMEDKGELPLALHLNCAFRKVIHMRGGINAVREVLAISSLIETYRIAIGKILSTLEEFLGIELFHIELISRSPEVSDSIPKSNVYISELHNAMLQNVESSESYVPETNRSRLLKRTELEQLLFCLPSKQFQTLLPQYNYDDLVRAIRNYEPVVFTDPGQVAQIVFDGGEILTPKDVLGTLNSDSSIHRFEIHSIDERTIAELMEHLAKREAYDPDPIHIVHSRTGYMSTFKRYSEGNGSKSGE